MLTPASHVPQLSRSASCALHFNHQEDEDSVTERSMKLGVMDGLLTITRQAWLPVLDAEDDDPEWPSA